MTTLAITMIVFTSNIAILMLFGVLGYLYRTALNNLERKHHNEPSLLLQGEAKIAPPTAREKEMDAINAELEIELRKRLSQI